MKKVTSLVLSIVLCVLFIMPTPASAHADSTINVVINGNELSLSVKPQMKNGSVLVPARAILEALGATVTYDSSKDAISATKEDMKLVMYPNSKTMYINDTADTMTPPIFIGSTVFVSVRDIAKCFNAKVVWNNYTNTVCIFDYDHTDKFACYQYKDQDNGAAGYLNYDKLPDFGACSGYGRSAQTSTIKEGNNTVSYYQYNTSIMPNSTYFWVYYTNLLTELGFSETTSMVKGANFFVYTKGAYTVFVPSLRYDNCSKVTISVVYDKSYSA